MSEHTATRETTELTRIKYFRKMPIAVLPFVWWGLLPLILLGCVLLYGATHFASHTIEQNVARDTERALTAAGLSKTHIEVDGQDVHLSNLTSADLDEAIEVAENTRGHTFFGGFVSPRTVTAEADLAAPMEPPLQPLRVEQVERVEEVSEPPRWADIAATLDEGVLVLSGDVESEQAKLRLGALAEQHLDPPRLASVSNELRVVSSPVRDGSLLLAERAVQSVTGCSRGRGWSAEGVFSLTCAATNEAEADVRRIAEGELEYGTVGAIRVLLSEAIDACEQTFERLLDRRTIRFAVGSAELRSSSDRLLSQIAEAARTCPGTLQVQGHTDDTGDLDANMLLSRERAQSVRQALIARDLDANRLVPRGFGPTRPRAEGTSSAARARNRRIEFHIIFDDPSTTQPEGTE